MFGWTSRGGEGSLESQNGKLIISGRLIGTARTVHRLWASYCYCASVTTHVDTDGKEGFVVSYVADACKLSYRS